MAEALAEGLQEEQKYRQFGANDDQINEWKTSQIADFRKAGANDQQINDYFGVKETDTKGMRAYVDKNLAAFHESRKAADGTPQKEAASWGEYFDAGWENSVTGLAKAGHMPDTVLPEHAGFAGRLVSNIAQLTGDVPAMLAGSVAGSMVGAAAGGAAGSVVPVVGTLGGIAAGSVGGAGAGAFAAPAAMRKLLMDHYEKGDVKDAGDFLSRLAAVTWEATKGGTIGALTAGSGALAKPVAGAMGSLAAELTTMTTAGAAMEGRLPQPQEFLDGAVMLGGFHLATGGVPTKLRNIFAATGERPAEVVEAAHNDPVLKQEILSENSDLPKQAAPITPDQAELDAKLGGNIEGERPPKEKSEGPPPGGGDSGLSLEEASAKIRSKIKEQQGPEDFKLRDLLTTEGRDKAILKLRKDYEDSLLPLKQAEKESGLEFKPGQSPSDLARIVNGASGVAERMINTETIDHATGHSNGEGILPILDAVGKANMGRFEEFVVSRRVLERESMGFKHGFDKDAAGVVVAAGEKEFTALADRYSAFNDRVLKYYKDAGGLTDSSESAIENQSKHYAPMARVLSVDPFTGEPMIKDKKLIAFMDGSDKDILNPIQQSMKRAQAVALWVARNDAAKAYGKMVEESEFGGALGEKIDKPSGPLKNNEISYFDNGEKKVIRMPKDYAEALKSMGGNPGQTNLFMTIMKVPAQALRIGTVLNPDFLLRHFGRGIEMSAVQSRSSVSVLHNVLQTFQGIGHIVAKDDVWNSYLSSGAVQRDIGGAIGYIKERFWEEQSKGAPSVMDKIWNSPRTIKEALEFGSMIADNAFRVAEFKRTAGAVNEAGNWEVGSKGQIQAGAIAARDITLDYNRRGAQMQAFSSVVPFANVGIQGTSRMIRGIVENPVSYGAKAVAMITVPSLITYFLNHDDPRYKDAPNWEKDLYWLFPTDKWEPAANMADAQSRPEQLRKQAPDGSWLVNNGTTVRIMKPFELGILFGTLPERLLARYVGDNPRALTDLGSTISRGIIPNVLPTAITPFLEQGSNKNFFTGRPVVSSHAEGMLPEYQYNEYTSNVAKTLGKLIGHVPGLRDIGPKDAKLASPMVIDNYIHDWTGTMGQYVLQALNYSEHAYTGGPPPPAMSLAEYPIIKAFISRNPSQNAQPIQDFYNDFEKASRVNATISSLMKSGDPASAQEALRLSQKYQGDMLQLGPVKQALGQIAKSLQGINESPVFKPYEKRQLMDAAYYQMSMIAKQGNRIIDANRKALNAQQ